MTADPAILTSLVLFAHGKESGPWGSKIRHLAEVAQGFGAHVLSPDYSDLVSADERVLRLLALDLPTHDRLILVGSSMGGYVSTVASARLKPDCLFLMAPAFGVAGYAEQSPVPHANAVCVIHGWQDDIIPVESGIRFAERHRAELHVLNADHRLNSVLPELGRLFGEFLRKIITASAFDSVDQSKFKPYANPRQIREEMP